MKALNIDALAKANRTLTLGGKEYVVEEMTVENFIATSKAAEKLGSNSPLSEQIEAAVEMILRSVPSLAREAISKLSLDHLTTIVKFVRGDLDTETATEVANAAEVDAKPVSKSKKPGK